MVFKNKRGQGDAGNAAVLVALIGGIILLYILFLPPAERAELLGENLTDEDHDGTDNGENKTLLSESPGRIDFLATKEYTHDIPSFTLFKTTNSQIISTINPFYVKNSWFDTKTKTATFNIDDVENTENVFLTFTADKHKGVLAITLNGQIVSESELTTANIAPINLPKNLLQKTNTLEFSVSESGWAFWSANIYSLQNINIIGDITDLSKQESTNVFHLTSTEAANLESVTLEFNPECRQNQVGTLDVTINYETVFSGIPDCGSLNRVEFSPGILSSGTNKVIFKTEMGSYLLDQIVIETRLKESLHPTYYFELSAEEFEDVENDDKDALLHFEFVKADEDREVEVTINGRTFTVDIDEGDKSYSKNINDYLREEENYVKLVPQTVLEIVKLKITLG